MTLIIEKHSYGRLPNQFLNQVKFNQVKFITVIIVIITNSSIITIINVFVLILSSLSPLLLVFQFFLIIIDITIFVSYCFLFSMLL